MSKYEKVKSYYDCGLWDKRRVEDAIGIWITEEEYNKIIENAEENESCD